MKSISQQIESCTDYNKLTKKDLDNFISSISGTGGGTYNISESEHKIETLKKELHQLKLKTDKDYAKTQWDIFIKNEYNKYIMTEEWFEAYRLHTIQIVNSCFDKSFFNNITGNKESIVYYIYKLQGKNLYKIKANEFYMPFVIDIKSIPEELDIKEFLKLWNETGIFFIESDDKYNTIQKL